MAGGPPAEREAFQPEPSTGVDELPFAVVDVETTGLYAESGDRVVEIAILSADGRGETEAFSALVNPERPIAPAASAVNGISDADVAGAPVFAELAGEVVARLEGRVLVAHNARFDASFLRAELLRAGRTVPTVPTLCTLELARRNFRFRSNALGSLAGSLGLDPGQAHRAESDARTTLGLLDWQLTELAGRGLRTWRDLQRAQGGARGLAAPPGPALAEPLATALRRHKPVYIRYENAGRKISTRLVVPRAAGRGQMVAYCHLRRAERTFRIDRIQAAWFPGGREG